MARTKFDLRHLEKYLSHYRGSQVQIEEVSRLGGNESGAAALKAFGYGQPLLIAYHLGGERHTAVLRQVARNGFGREMASDRAAAVWLDFNAFNQLPAHAAALDMVGLAEDGQLTSLGHLQDLLLLTEYVPGQPYADDLARIRDKGKHTDQDLARAQALATYIAGIHAAKHDDPLLWRRRLRDLVGHGEGIMGLADSYPTGFPLFSPAELEAVEQAANRWRWRLKPLTHRLSQVHGDFHPFNLLFVQGTTFRLIDRSRGKWGEPADDVSCLSINYLFFSLQRYGRLEEPFAALHETFWETYLAQRADDELTAVIQPWYAWRALVLASPQWYPTLEDGVRRKLLAFARRVLAEDHFNWRSINDYLAK